MKKLSFLLFALIGLISLNSCTEDDPFTFEAKPDPEGLAFTSTVADNYNLTASNAENLAERFVWNPVDFDVQTPITYELQGSTTQDFMNFDVIGTSSESNIGVTIAQMMSLASDAGLDNDPTTEDMPNTGTIYFRVRAYIGTDGGNAVQEVSDIISVNVTLPEEEEENTDLPKIYVTGSFGAASGYGADWNPEAGVPLAASAVGETDYEGFIYMNVDAPEYKFLPQNDGWDGDYGDAGEENGAYTGVLLQDGEVNAGTPDGTGGYFWVKADTEALTYSLTETNWGVIGNATPTGWDSDTDMTYDAENKIWTLTLDLTAQEAPDNGIKFRANDGWDINIGDSGADGTMEFGGDNIGVPEDGNYTITLDLSNPRMYTYTLTKN
ncbi:SusE domain-containing protein [Gramella lutea]|uniref:SusE domain-containing protein n=1 Tax=Christiangramia lutea TaxID=1607951 RepID=A0A9X2AC30_9FLAO|nr:SusE domain-containing protein [Christiangramia lutea]MCH4823678.1 SusE domain-containing protein [Christiangramia lutea]